MITAAGLLIVIELMVEYGKVVVVIGGEVMVTTDANRKSRPDSLREQNRFHNVVIVSASTTSTTTITTT